MKITNVYEQKIPASRFIGMKYGDDDRVSGLFSHKWDDWFQRGFFKPLQRTEEELFYEDEDAFIGFMRYKKDEPFQYWIGKFMPEKTMVPDGYEYIDFDERKLGVCWLYGKVDELFAKEGECGSKLRKKGYKIAQEEDGSYIFFERYSCPRFTQPDECGNVILDICHYIKES